VLIAADFETHYSTTYSLSRLTTEAYIRSPEYETIGVAIKIDDGPTRWYPQPEVEAALRAIDWSQAFLLCQNTMFDGAILAWRYGIVPKGYFDTLAMSRALFPHEKSHSLASQAFRAEIGTKGDEVVYALGKRFKDFAPADLARYGEYCKNDVELTYKLFQQYLTMGFPQVELKLIDLTVRMFTQPRLRLDADLLIEHLRDVKHRKQDLLDAVSDKLGITNDEELKRQLMSNEKFAQMLRDCGVEPPVKVSITTGKEVYAFAKTDEEFIALQDHSDECVQALVAARLGNKSTLEETRTERFIEMSGRGDFPVPLRYYGGHVGRWAGQDSVNLQNLPSRGPQAGKLKRAILPPKDHVLIESDSAQIECVSGDTEVLTRDRGYVRIVDILKTDLLWDGVEWVSHTGVVFKGYREVITYAGITGTPDHIVYTADGRRLQLSVAASEGASLAVGERGGKAVRFVADTTRPDSAGRSTTSVGAVRALLSKVSSAVIGFAQRKIYTVQARCRSAPVLLDATPASIPYAPGEIQPDYVVYQPVVHQSGLPSIPGARYAKPIRVVRGVRTVRMGEFAASHVPGGRDRPDRQYGALRTGQFAVRDAGGKRAEPGVQYIGGVSRQTNEHSKISSGIGASLSCNYDSGLASRSKGVGSRRVIPVFDITNAGPRHRFTANGVIISNCRTLAWLAGQDDLVEAFANKEDVYKLMASKVYGIPTDQVSKYQRQVGKTLVLGCGYGVGHKKLRAFLKVQAGVEVDEAEAKRLVDTYRHANHRIVDFWKRADTALTYLAAGMTYRIDERGIALVVPRRGVSLPNRLHVQYPELRQVASESGKAQWVYTSRGETTYIYGAKCVENITQGVARCIIGEQMLMISKRYPVVLTVHDSVVCVAPKEEADAAQAFVEECMRSNPSWAKGLPLSCESGVGESYGAC